MANYPTPAGWRGGSDDFTYLRQGMGGHVYHEPTCDLRAAADSWDDFDLDGAIDITSPASTAEDAAEGETY